MRASFIARQDVLLRFIAGYQQAHDGISPTLRQCGAALGTRSAGAVHSLLTALERAGRIRRLKHKARAIELLDVPPVPTAPDGQPLFSVPVIAAAPWTRQRFAGARRA